MATKISIDAPPTSSAFNLRSLPVSFFFSPISQSSSRSLSYSTNKSRIGSCRSHCFPATNYRRSFCNLTSSAAIMLAAEYPVLSDICATGITSLVALSCLRFWGEIANRGIFDQSYLLRYLCYTVSMVFSIFLDICAAFVCISSIFAFLLMWQATSRLGLDGKLNRKLVHISIGLVFILCWPLFSSGYRGAILAALAPVINILRMLLLGLGIYKDEGTVKSMTRYGDPRELLKGPLYYAASIASVCILYWRTPIAIAVICNLCAGDGAADIVGRRFGKEKLPYNRNKSIAGSIAMATAGFLASVGYMYYFASFGYIEDSWRMILGFFVVSIASALVESLPISTELDDNLTVSLASVLVGNLVF